MAYVELNRLLWQCYGSGVCVYVSSKMCAGPTQRLVRAGPCCPAGTLTARRAAVLSLSTAAAEATGITLSQRSTACLSAAASVSPAGSSECQGFSSPVFNSHFYRLPDINSSWNVSRLVCSSSRPVSSTSDLHFFTHLFLCASVRQINVFALKTRLYPSCNPIWIPKAANLIVSLFPLLLPSVCQFVGGIFQKQLYSMLR